MNHGLAPLYMLHQKPDQIFVVASFGVTKIDKSGSRLNFNLRFYDEYLELCVVNNSISHSMISHNNATLPLFSDSCYINT